MKLLDDLRIWLKDNGKDRQWLARECGVSKHTIDGWFAGRPITSAAIPTLERIVYGPPQVEYKTTLEHAAAILEAAKSEGLEPMEWVERAIAKALLARRKE